MWGIDPTKRFLSSSYVEEIEYFSWMIDQVFFFDKKIAIGQSGAAFWGYGPGTLRSITGTFFGEDRHFF
jgi:hypothetical protein